MTGTTPLERRHYVDWVRVIAFFLLIGFHCAMPFVDHPWEVKNKETSAHLTSLIWWLHQWRLPLLFFVSGVGIHFSLRRRTVWAFAGERVVRLFIPLLFAMFFTIPLQVYVEKLQKGLIPPGYAAFYPTVWNLVPYPEGTLSWSHMWFVVYLFVFCMILLPVFALFKIPVLSRARTAMASFLSQPIELVGLFLPLLALFLTLYLPYPEQASLLDDWFLFLKSLLMLMYGYFLGGSDCFWANAERHRRKFLFLALVTMAWLFKEYWWTMELPKEKGIPFYRYAVLDALHIWSMMLALLGYAKRYLNRSSSFLGYMNRAVYPYYIIHQTIIVVLGFQVVQWQQPIWVKLPLLTLASLISIAGIYHFVIRPFKLTRFLFGMKKD